MKFITTVEHFKNAISAASHATPTNPTLVAYSGILLRVEDGVLKTTGSDGETTITSILGVTSEKDGQLLLPPKPIMNYLTHLDSNVKLAVESVGGDLKLEGAGFSPYQFRGLTSTFPPPPNFDQQGQTVNLNGLEKALVSIRASIDKDTPAVQIVCRNGNMKLHSTDTFRVSGTEIKHGSFKEGFEGLLPLSVLDRVSKENIAEIAVDSNGNTVYFIGPGIVIASRLLELPFPAVESVLDVPPPFATALPGFLIIKALERLGSLVEDVPLHCEFRKDELVFKVNNVDIGTASEIVDLEEDIDEGFSFLVNFTYFTEAIKAHEAAELTFGWTSPSDALFLFSKGENKVTTVVMPIRNTK